MCVADNAAPRLEADAPVWLLLRATLLFRQTTLLREQVGVGVYPTQNVRRAYCISVDLRTDDEHLISMIAPGCALLQPERSEHPLSMDTRRIPKVGQQCEDRTATDKSQKITTSLRR